jgi:lipopolysaccharide/colanic/teichoic acid biosynthesis glycosyltransferase
MDFKMTVSVSERYTERLNASKIIKRVIDIIGSLALLVLFSPLFLVVALMVSLDGGPVFYRHKRIGRDGKPFGCLKFRTMILGAEACLNEYLSYHPEQRREWEQDQKLAFDPRVTAIGNVLRRLSLDELPQLVNVLVGEMSLVGPRPVTEGELKRCGAGEIFRVDSHIAHPSRGWRTNPPSQRRVSASRDTG